MDRPLKISKRYILNKARSLENADHLQYSGIEIDFPHLLFGNYFNVGNWKPFYNMFFIWLQDKNPTNDGRIVVHREEMDKFIQCLEILSGEEIK